MNTTLVFVIAWVLIVACTSLSVPSWRYRFLLLRPKQQDKRQKDSLSTSCFFAVKIVIGPYYTRIHDAYCSTQTHLKYKSKEFVSYTVRKICRSLELHDIQDFSALSIDKLLEIVTSFKATNPRSIGRIVLNIGHFFEYLKAEGISDIVFPFSLLHVQQRYEKIPCYSKHEIKAMLQACDRSTISGKRSYAIILLAVTCGLRQCDIQRLTLQSIDWHDYELLVLQEKTQSYVTLPLLSETGNAVADYILYARPKTCGYEQIFASASNPSQPIGPSVCKHILERLEEKASIQVIKKRGFHSLRRSTATWLAESGTPVTTIVQILGQNGMHTVDKYISTNAKMRLCCLGFKGIHLESEVYR